MIVFKESLNFDNIVCNYVTLLSYITIKFVDFKLLDIANLKHC